MRTWWRRCGTWGTGSTIRRSGVGCWVLGPLRRYPTDRPNSQPSDAGNSSRGSFRPAAGTGPAGDRRRGDRDAERLDFARGDGGVAGRDRYPRRWGDVLIAISPRTFLVQYPLSFLDAAAPEQRGVSGRAPGTPVMVT